MRSPPAGRWGLACLLAALPFAAFADDGGASGSACGENPGEKVGMIFIKIADQAGIRRNASGFYDPAVKLPVLLFYDSGNRFAHFNCDTKKTETYSSVAATTLCSDTWALTFGMGVCEAAKNESEIASVIAHEVSHLSMRHSSARMAYQNKLYGEWVKGEGQPDWVELRDQGNAEIQAQVQAEHPELAKTRNPDKIEAIMAPYKKKAADDLAQKLWDRFLEKKQPMIDKFAQEKESEADVNGLNILAQAGFDRNAAADMMDHFAQLRKATDLEYGNRHPPSSVRAQVLRDLAAQLGGPGGSP